MHISVTYINKLILHALLFSGFDTFQSRLYSVVWTLNPDRDESVQYASNLSPCQQDCSVNRVSVKFCTAPFGMPSLTLNKSNLLPAKQGVWELIALN